MSVEGIDAKDIMKFAKAKISGEVEQYVKKAQAAHAKGLKLVSERILQPFNGYGFELKKGQTIRYELIDAPQIIDTIYLVKDRPTLEHADLYHSTTFGAMELYEGMTFWSNSPYNNPLASIIRDTVDVKSLKEKYGSTAAHGWIWAAARCTAAIFEHVYGAPNPNSCDMNLRQGIMEVAGREVAAAIQTPHSFNWFQPHDWSVRPLNHKFLPSQGVFKRGDYVELLAHQDLYVSVSMCPVGTAAAMDHPSKFENTPLKVQIYEGQDGPLETAPPSGLESDAPMEFLDKGRPGMVSGVLVAPDSPMWFKE